MCTPFEEAVSVICLRADSVDGRVDWVRDWATATVSVVIFAICTEYIPDRRSVCQIDVVYARYTGDVREEKKMRFDAGTNREIPRTGFAEPYFVPYLGYSGRIYCR